MTASKIHLYSFLRHLVNEKYARAQKDLEQIVEGKIRAKARIAKQKIQKAPATAKVSSKNSKGENK